MMRKILLATTLILATAPVAAQTTPGPVTSQVSNATGCTTAAPNFAASAGGFGVLDGQIYSPGGTPFIARGINIRSNELGDVLNGSVLSKFPGVNFVRVNIRALDDPASLKSAVDYLTAKGIVVELEDHPDAGGGQDTWASQPGDVAWYGQAAAFFKNNPYVWFGSFNEPNPDNLSAWQQATYAAIRGAGNNNPILMEPSGWDPASLDASLDPNVYAGMTNVIADPHAYNFQTHYSTDQGTVNANIKALTAATQRRQSADGIMPVIIAEYGDSTNGSTPDAGGMQNVQAVINSGVGSAAWAWLSAGSDALRNGDGSLSGYGQTVAAFTKNSGTQGCAESPIAIPDPTPGNAQPSEGTQQAGGTNPTASPPATTGAQQIMPGQGSVTDSQGNTWTISSSGSIRMGDTWVPGGGGTSELIIVNGVVYGKDDGHGPVNAGGWFTLSANGQYWTPSAPPSSAELGAATATAGSAQPATAPPLAPATTTDTAPSLSPASTAQTAPPLRTNSLSVADVAAMAAGQ